MTGFNKERFAKLLNKARGDRSINEFARQSMVSAAHISRLSRGLLDTPPSANTIQKLAQKSHNVSYQEFMSAAGWDHINEKSDGYLDMPTNDAIEKEIFIAKESGIDINYETAARMVENRRKYPRGLGDKNIDYIYQAKTLGDALTRVAELDIEYDFDDETMFKLVKKAREKYGLPKASWSEPAANGPKIPGTGVFDDKGGEIE